MPTARELEEGWAAQFHLFGGPPPDEQHNIKTLEDPAYRAAHEAGSRYPVQKPIEHRDGAKRSTHYVSDNTDFLLYFDKKNQRVVKICPRMECVIQTDGGDEILGVAEYNPATQRETFTYFSPRVARHT